MPPDPEAHQALLSEYAWSQVNVFFDVCVDDRQETIDAFGGALISSYAFGGPDDGDMCRVYELIRGSPPCG